jgi:CBS domain-containing protein
MLGLTRRNSDAKLARRPMEEAARGEPWSKEATKTGTLIARQIMTTPVHTVCADTSVEEAVQLLASQRISGVPVLDGQGAILGMLTEADLIDEHKRETQLPRTLLYGVFPLPDDVLLEAVRRGKMLKASDLMTKRVVTATEETTIHELADLMVQHWINRIPIVRGGRLVGIVSRSDLVRALAKGRWP